MKFSEKWLLDPPVNYGFEDNGGKTIMILHVGWKCFRVAALCSGMHIQWNPDLTRVHRTAGVARSTWSYMIT